MTAETVATAATPVPINCALAVMAGFFFAGLAQTAFLKSELASRFAQPIDGGLTLSGQPLLGSNKTLRGFVVMLPAVTLCYALIGVLQAQGWWSGLWPLGIAGWARLGLITALAYTCGELPNSFLKRRLGILPGEAPKNPLGRRFAYIADQTDSILAGLVAIALTVPTDGEFWLLVLVIGALVHAGFNVLLRAIGVKGRSG